jgi:pilus assembly protein CpaF
VNGADFIYVERNGQIETTKVRFISEEHLHRIIDRIVTQVGRRIDESSPWSMLVCLTSPASTSPLG